MIIDVHTHIVPESFPLVGDRKSFGRWPLVQPSGPDRADVIYHGKNFRTVFSGCWDVPKRVEEMAPQGVDRHVLSPMPRLIDYDLEADDAIELSRWLNETIMRMVEE